MLITRCLWRHRALCVLLLVLASSTRSFAAESVLVPTGALIRITRELQPTIDAMLQRSPTFRSLYTRVASAPSLIVGVRADLSIAGRSYMARSTIRRYGSGLLIVDVVVQPGRDQDGWIAHEFEHIAEQLDGWDLRTLAQRHGSGVWYSGDQMIETGRAARAGRAVLAEMKRRIRWPDNLVQ